MKAFSKDGKLFGKISILDIIIIVAVLFIALAFAFKSTDSVDLSMVSKTDVNYIVEFKAHNVTKTEQSPFAVGEKIYSNNGELIGEVTAVEQKPMFSRVKLNDGSFINLEKDENVDYFVTVKGSGAYTDSGFAAAGTLLMQPNSTINASSKYYQGGLVVLSVKKTV